MPGGEVPPRRHRLAAELHRLRLEAGLSQDELGRRLGLSRTQVVKREKGLTMARVADVEAWARATDASPEEAAALREMAQQTRVEALALRGRSLAGMQYEVHAEEAAIRSLRIYTPTSIPGLLQTRAYIEAIFSTDIWPVRVTEEGIRARLERQGVLHDETKGFEFIIGEAALRFRFGPPKAHLAQLERLRIMSALPNVSIGVLPIAAPGPLWWKHDINLFENGEPYVGVETLTATLTVTDRDDVARFRRAFAALREAALFGDEALGLLARIEADVRASG